MIQWLKDRHNITSNRLHRDFSDGFLMGQILKRILPDHVELNNYPRRNGFKSKLYNWETINKNMLVKLQMKLSKNVMEKLASSRQDTIDVVLYKLMTVEKEMYENIKKYAAQESMHCIHNDIHCDVVSKESDMDVIVQAPSEMISYLTYAEVKTDLKKSCKSLCLVQEKSANLENQRKLMDECINTLCSQIAEMCNSF
ncbi:sperm flagellar protein 1-like [Teleopsis dalmanni]|uniref:sperm flagellar protein 1-like n=1 Tax=Teleopsis dalmanni TaxID=139649 RepID=UPI0018CF1966|nr:sperm flagellar protein 1-like [Teleopsis dalmanni]